MLYILLDLLPAFFCVNVVYLVADLIEGTFLIFLQEFSAINLPRRFWKISLELRLPPKRISFCQDFVFKRWAQSILLLFWYWVFDSDFFGRKSLGISGQVPYIISADDLHKSDKARFREVFTKLHAGAPCGWGLCGSIINGNNMIES